jgi:hypothetical protein
MGVYLTYSRKLGVVGSCLVVCMYQVCISFNGRFSSFLTHRIKLKILTGAGVKLVGLDGTITRIAGTLWVRVKSDPL